VGRRDEERAALRGLGRPDSVSYLSNHSGLPGPRANIELALAVADEGDSSCFDELIATKDEFLVMCGTIGLGRLLAECRDDEIEGRLRAHAVDPRWRIREAVAMALQRVGDTDIGRLLDLADNWSLDPRALVQRAAVAGVCEPRLLRASDAAARAVALCGRVTDALAKRPTDERKADDVRVLRQALGYCWSVAVAADPQPGLRRFRDLEDSSDMDVAWIVRENSRKSRLARLL